MNYNATQRSAQSRLFSSGVFRELAVKGYSPLFARLFRQTGLPTPNNVASAFEEALAALRKSEFRDEYVFRAALTKNILLGRHSLNTASMLTEFRTGASKADVVILNGTGTVYEIKSDRDSLSRLQGQLSDYRKVFGCVYVITGEKHISEVINGTPNAVGVMSLTKRGTIHTVREAVDQSSLVCPITIFDSLRISESRAVIESFGITVPHAPNTMLHGLLREYFKKLDPVAVHSEMVKILKKTRNQAPLENMIRQLPASLQPAALSVKVKKSDHDKLTRAINTPFVDALSWG